MERDSAGNLYFADSCNHKIKKITPAGVVTTFAGSTSGFLDDTGTAAKFKSPYGLAIDGSDNIYVADRSNNRIRMITPAAVVTTIMGINSRGFIDGMVMSRDSINHMLLRLKMMVLFWLLIIITMQLERLL